MFAKPPGNGAFCWAEMVARAVQEVARAQPKAHQDVQIDLGQTCWSRDFGREISSPTFEDSESTTALYQKPISKGENPINTTKHAVYQHLHRHSEPCQPIGRRPSRHSHRAGPQDESHRLPAGLRAQRGGTVLPKHWTRV